MRIVTAVSLALALSLAGVAGESLAMGSSTPSSAPAKPESDYSKGERAVKAKDYKGAIPLLEKVVASDPKNADAFNYLGFSHRKLGDKDKALANYKKALDIDPNHLGANEYLGELYLEMGDLPSAEQRLATLDKFCKTCEETHELREAVEKFKKTGKAS
ncbi:MAG: tetratricopeptide repeat protein [Alphaproteobacteria bacterium]